MAMRKKKATKKKVASAPAQPTIQVVGEVVIDSLDKVQPNGWNPNRMTPEMKESLQYGMLNDGWLAAQALLIWETDEQDNEMMVIIDGEHRWTVATEMGLTEGPMVYLKGLTEAQAKALTIKMNQKRGDFVQEMLGELVRDIQNNIADDIVLDLGIPEEELMSMLSAEPLDLETPEGTKPTTTEDEDEDDAPGGMRGASGYVQQVQLFFKKDDKEKWDRYVAKAAKKFGTENVSDTVFEAVKRAVATKE